MSLLCKEGNVKKRSLITEENYYIKEEKRRRKPKGELLEHSKYGNGMTWSRGAMIGKGSFGSVFLANLKKPRSKYSSYPPIMAVKSAEVSVSGSIQKEMEILNNIRGSPYVIKCFGEEITNGVNGEMIYNLLLEYGSGGTLADLIKKSGNKGLPELDVKRYTRSILRGLCHVHHCGYVHCDLKPENILLVSNSKGAGFKATIGDLGLAKRAKQRKKSKLGPFCYWRGTPMYLSPEAVIDGIQEAPSDVWAIGCIVLEMLTGKPPWDSKHEMDAEGILSQIAEENKLPCIPSTVSIEGRNFLKGCFSRKVMYRLTAEMLLAHPFLEGLVDDEDEDGEIEEMGEVLDINAISSSMVFSDIDEEEFSFSSISDDSINTFNNMENEVGSCFSVEESSQAEESTNATLNEVQQYPITFTISAGV